MIQREMNLDIAHNAVNVNGAYLRGQDLWEKVPDFRYESPDATWVVSRQWLPLLLLFAWTIAAVGLAWHAASKLQVE